MSNWSFFESSFFARSKLSLKAGTYFWPRFVSVMRANLVSVLWSVFTCSRRSRATKLSHRPWSTTIVSLPRIFTLVGPSPSIETDMAG